MSRPVLHTLNIVRTVNFQNSDISGIDLTKPIINTANIETNEKVDKIDDIDRKVEVNENTQIVNIDNKINFLNISDSKFTKTTLVIIDKCDRNNCGKCKIGNFAGCFNKSFISNYRSKYWSKTNAIKPRNIGKSSHEKFLFDCDICEHSFEKVLNDVTQKNSWCPYCNHRELCKNIDCKDCYEKSFASSQRAIYWSKENNINPRFAFKSTKDIYKFNCYVCKHNFEMSLKYITHLNCWCQYCENQKLCDNSNCIDCFNKSFKSHELVKYWSIKNNIDPRFIFQGSNDKYIFDCPYCSNTYLGIVKHVVNGVWCLCVKNKTENKLYEWLANNYNLTIDKQKKFEWCKNITYLPLDFCIDKFKLIIELDGRQHFEQITGWELLENIQTKDKYKMNCANRHGYSVIRIYQPDVWSDKNNWNTNLQLAIKKYDTPTNTFIGKFYQNVSIYHQ